MYKEYWGFAEYPFENLPNPDYLYKSPVHEEALTRLVEMRETEGAAISADLTKHAAATSKLVERIEKRMPNVVRTHQKNLEKRVSQPTSAIDTFPR